jgi:anaerobic magnesium-protoporphyrin IX monomethyl ester cyclase
MKTVILFNPNMEKKDKVTWVPGGSRGANWTNRECMLPLGNIMLASSLKKNGFKVDIVDGNIQSSDVLYGMLDDSLCVGISCSSSYDFKESLSISNKIREKSDIPIIWGGLYSSLISDKLIEEKSVDAVVVGYGEKVIVDIANILSNNGKVQGIISVDDFDMNDHPPMDMNDVVRNKYFLNIDGVKVISYSSSRGCLHNCYFCSVCQFNKHKYYSYTIDRVVSDLKEIREFYEGVLFTDDNFCQSFNRVEGICDSLVRDNVGIKWIATCRYSYIKNYSDIFLCKMYSSGCRVLNFGIQSGSQRILDIVNRKESVVDAAKVVDRCLQNKIAVMCDFIIGFPGETSEDREKTLSLIEQVYSLGASVRTYHLSDFEGTYIHDNFDYKVDKKNIFIVNVSQLLFTSRKIKKGLWFILYHIERFRWKKRFFSFPVEWKMAIFLNKIFKIVG